MPVTCNRLSETRSPCRSGQDHCPLSRLASKRGHMRCIFLSPALAFGLVQPQSGLVLKHMGCSCREWGPDQQT